MKIIFVKIINVIEASIYIFYYKKIEIKYLYSIAPK